ncbi:MAG: HAD-IIIA family hydrolase [Bacillota bacterium]|nr:HAD-IIIA family hydrolase [Bacillota bacterium]
MPAEDRRGYLDDWLAWTQSAVRSLEPAARCLADLVSLVLAAGGSLYVCGNGGSAADAQHFAAELVGRFLRERAALPVVALTANTSVLTALGNDYGFDAVFGRQVEAMARPGDCLMVISTSGRSPNVLAALRAGRRQGVLTIALVGPEGLDPSVVSCCDFCLAVSGPDGGTAETWSGMATPHVQEVHLALLHYVAHLVERGVESRRGRPRRCALRPAVFLDRDGTVVQERGHITDERDLAVLPGAADAVRRLKGAGFVVVLTTNQSVVARRLVDGPGLERLHGRLRALAGERGAVLDAIYHCPHHPEHGLPGGPCACRKPMPGMMLRAADEMSLDLGASFVIGDNWTDVQAAAACGAHGVLVLTGSGAGALAAGSPLAAESAGRWSVATDLAAAADDVIARHRANESWPAPGGRAGTPGPAEAGRGPGDDSHRH